MRYIEAEPNPKHYLVQWLASLGGGESTNENGIAGLGLVGVLRGPVVADSPIPDENMESRYC